MKGESDAPEQPRDCTMTRLAGVAAEYDEQADESDFLPSDPRAGKPGRAVRRPVRMEVDTDSGEGDEDSESDSHRWQGDTCQIIYASRTHSQIKQVCRELGKTAYRPNMVVLGSRDQMCIHESISKEPNKNEGCRIAVSTKSCSYYLQKENLNVRDFKAGGVHEVWDIEDLVEAGQSCNACPYFVSRELAKTAHLILCPYNYLFDPLIRRSMSDIFSLPDASIILDEGHNIEDLCRDCASYTVRLDTLIELESLVRNGLAGMRKDMDSLDMVLLPPNFARIFELTSKLHEVLDAFKTMVNNIAMRQMTTHFETGTFIGGVGDIEGVFRSIGMSKDSYMDLAKLSKELAELLEPADAMNRSRKSRSDGAPRKEFAWVFRLLSQLEAIGIVADFFFQDRMANASDYRLVVTRAPSEARDSQVVTFNLWCMNPAVAFAAVRNESRVIILSSGTLSPMSSFSSELATEFPLRLEAQHVINLRQQVYACCLSKAQDCPLTCTFQNTNNFTFQDALGNMIECV